MAGPAPDRPWMPGYGVLPADQGSGLLPWTEAERRLTGSHDYWCATVRPDGLVTPEQQLEWAISHGRPTMAGSDSRSSIVRW